MSSSNVALFSARIAAALLMFFFADGFAWRQDEMEVTLTHVHKRRLVQLRSLRLRGDVWPIDSTVNATFYVSSSELAALKRIGLPCTITIPNTKEYYKNFWSLEKKRSSQSYHTVNQILAIMDSLAAAYPSLCENISLGRSINNKRLCMLKISNNVSLHENKAQVCFDGGIHGDEVDGPENLMLFAGELCSRYGTDSVATRLIDSREIFIYCMVNPDGREAMERGNAAGVDCNRDEGYMWNAENSPSVSSQPETRALRAAILSHQFVIQISYHSGMEEILYPWCFSDTATPDQHHHKALSDVYASTSGYGPSLPGLQSYADYPTHGETIDFNYGTSGVAGFTVEISHDKQPADIAGYYEKNKPAMMKMIEYAGYGIEGVVADSADGKPVAAVLYCGASFPFYSNPQLGDYHKFVTAGTYGLTVVANGYVSRTIPSIEAKSGASTNTPIRLRRDQSNKCFGYRVISVDSAQGATFSALGPPDNVACILCGGVGMVIDMQYPISDSTGREITVRVSGAASSYFCFAGQSPDGPWKLLGKSTKTDSFDLAQGGLPNAQYVKIQSDHCGLDAVEGKWNYTVTKDLTDAVGPSAVPYAMLLRTVNGKMELSVARQAGLALSIFDVQGRLCAAIPIISGKCVWRLPAKGVYVLEVTAQGKGLGHGRYIAQ